MSQPLRVKKLISEVLELLDPYTNFRSMIKCYHNSIEVQGRKLDLGERIHIFGLGKAASFEVSAFKKLLNESEFNYDIAQCVSYTKDGHTVNESGIVELEGTHPVVSAQNIEKTKEFINFLEQVSDKDTLIFLLSGGGSALLELPIDNLSFEQLQFKHKELLNSGKNINEMNKERKALSLVKDGGLLNYIKTNNIYQFVTCDIPNENLIDVSSGPLLAANDLSKHPITFMGQSASLLLESLANNLGYEKGVVFDGSFHDLIAQIRTNLPKKGSGMISGGEAPINLIKNAGKGGRNTHFVLALASTLYKDSSNKDIHICSIGTDGGDGPTDAAGAYINYELFQKLDSEEYLKSFDSYSYFEKINTLIKTGPTKTNVMDLRCIWRE